MSISFDVNAQPTNPSKKHQQQQIVRNDISQLPYINPNFITNAVCIAQTIINAIPITRYENKENSSNIKRIISMV